MKWVVVLAAMLTSACATGGSAVPRPFPGAPVVVSPKDPAPSASPSAPVEEYRSPVVDGYALVGTALTFRGVPYRNGGSDPTGFDCSVFTHYVFAQYGVTLAREVRE